MSLFEQRAIETVRKNLNMCLESFQMRAGMFDIHASGAWSCILHDMVTEEQLGCVQADSNSSLDKCAANGFDLMADFVNSRKSGIMLVSKPPRQASRT